MHKFLEAVVSFVNPLYGLTTSMVVNFDGYSQDGFCRYASLHNKPDGLSTSEIQDALEADPKALREFARAMRIPGAELSVVAEEIGYRFACRYARQYARLQAREAVPAEA